MKHYRLTSETKVNTLGVIVFRIELTVDCRWGKIGEKGGWAEKESNLAGNAWVSGDAEVYGNARVSGDACDKSPLQIQGTRHFFNISSKYNIQIGCQNMSAKDWLENGLEAAKIHKYTESEISEYRSYIELSIKLNKVSLE